MPSIPSKPQQNIVSLNAQINDVSSRLDAEKNVSLNKIKDVFNRSELAAIKTGITTQLESLSHEASEEIKADLNQLRANWEKVESKLQEEQEITELLQTAAAELKSQMNRVYEKNFQASTVNEWEGFTGKITQAVQPYFEQTVDQEQVEANYPDTLKSLFNLAVKLQKEDYGQKIKEAFTPSLDNPISHNGILTLLLYDLSHSNQDLKKTPPEIFSILKHSPKFDELLASLKNLDPQDLEMILLGENEKLSPQQAWYRKELQQFAGSLKIKSGELVALRQIFERNLNKLENPSHLTIKLFMGMDQIEKAIHAAKALKNPIEQSKSYSDLVATLLQKNDYNKATELAATILSRTERNKAEEKITEKYVQDDKIQEAISFAASLKDLEESDKALHQTAMQVAQTGKIEKAAQEIVPLIHDFDSQNYTLSCLVSVACSKGKVPTAIQLAFQIQDQGYREDAFAYIVKKQLSEKKIEEARQLIEKIENPKERTKANKIIESALVSFQQDQKIKSLRAGTFPWVTNQDQ